MDINSILPFLLANSSNSNIEKMMPFFNKNASSKQEENSPINQILKTAMQNKNTPHAKGLAPITKLANNDIIGKLYIYFSSVGR